MGAAILYAGKLLTSTDKMIVSCSWERASVWSKSWEEMIIDSRAYSSSWGWSDPGGMDVWSTGMDFWDEDVVVFESMESGEDGPMMTNER